jgi:hypothetical protein
MVLFDTDNTTIMKRAKTHKRTVVHGQELSLDEWLNRIRTIDNGIFPDFAFPTDAMRAEYLASISERSFSEVKDLIRKFLIHSCTTKGDLHRAIAAILYKSYLTKGG